MGKMLKFSRMAVCPAETLAGESEGLSMIVFLALTMGLHHCNLPYLNEMNTVLTDEPLQGFYS